MVVVVVVVVFVLIMTTTDMIVVEPPYPSQERNRRIQVVRFATSIQQGRTALWLSWDGCRSLTCWMASVRAF